MDYAKNQSKTAKRLVNIKCGNELYSAVEKACEDQLGVFSSEPGCPLGRTRGSRSSLCRTSRAQPDPIGASAAGQRAGASMSYVGIFILLTGSSGFSELGPIENHHSFSYFPSFQSRGAFFPFPEDVKISLETHAGRKCAVRPVR